MCLSMALPLVCVAPSVVQQDKSNLAAIGSRLGRVGRSWRQADGQEGVWIWRCDQRGSQVQTGALAGHRWRRSAGGPGTRLQPSCWYFIDLDFRDKSSNKVIGFRRRLEKRIYFHIKQQKWPVLSIPGGYFRAFSLDVCIKLDINSFVRNSMHLFPIVVCGWFSLFGPSNIKKVYMKSDYSSEGIKTSQWPLNLIWATWVSVIKAKKSAGKNVLIKDEDAPWINRSGSKDTWP